MVQKVAHTLAAKKKVRQPPALDESYESETEHRRVQKNKEKIKTHKNKIQNVEVRRKMLKRIIKAHK